MVIRINGRDAEVETGLRVGQLLDEMGRDPRLVAIELDGEILPRELYDATEVRSGARLEIVGFVQGG